MYKWKTSKKKPSNKENIIYCCVAALSGSSPFNNKLIIFVKFCRHNELISFNVKNVQLKTQNSFSDFEGGWGVKQFAAFLSITVYDDWLKLKLNFLIHLSTYAQILTQTSGVPSNVRFFLIQITFDVPHFT